MSGLPRILENGYIVYPKRGKIPPDCPDGYKRKSEHGGDAWIFIPLWPECEFRAQLLRRREECNCETIVTICGHSDMNGAEITYSVCRECIICPSKLKT
jgi:hypothetical protein